ncbi:hypothetical protein PR202_ga21659 [Eleusine coracana subsp. coracana]|uniref:AB hydrolase-1 domain-containing protein n=1 Tax=Eleusine coracana subsp. coracana TaxID=191504 RepID=A0AAV5D1J4_ELECO|nr:hypothetical protein PR202_ga21659 [Eleusine coracana subsp. coracana]
MQAQRSDGTSCVGVQDGLSWLLASPEESLAFVLADHGFDVWIANTRGTRWSRRHVSLDPSSRLYWNWSWDDLVVNDLPAMVDYVCSKTWQKPHYVGHSMGTLVALAAFSEGRLVDELKSAALLTPVAYLAHITTPIGILLAKAFVGEVLSDFLGLAEFNPTAPPVASLVRTICRKQGTNCYDLVGSITGKDSSTATCIHANYQNENIERTLPLALFSSVKYDYVLPFRNIANYGQIEPPVYEMSNIPADFPLFLSYGGRDALADPTDVRRLLNDLRGHDPGKLTVQYLDQFAHLDFVMGVCAKDYVYKDVIAFFDIFH